MEIELPLYLEYGSRLKKSYSSIQLLVLQNKKRKAVSKMKSHHFFLSCGSAGIYRSGQNIQ